MSDGPGISPDTAERPAPRLSARALRRRGEILRAAHEVFTTRGFRNGSLGEIADRVGITHQGILHYFGSKEQLLVEVLRDRDAGGRLEFEDAERPQGVDFLQHVLSTVEKNVSRTGIVQAYTVLSAESVTEGHPAQGWFRDRFDGLRAELAEALRIACGAHAPSAEQLDRAASALIAVMDGLQVQWLLDPGSVDMPAVVRMTVDALLRSWGCPPLTP
ncbi:TetR/AcrR family transcriptional regulator [Pseudonocardia lacus]|uniref:TetR/AcrR family transcriptional regulator n=1 Tax=Pseudonocardia lacus TaxID=2835865 RepID=UPI001BDD2196|nr:TetR/AcrR family transcriptional regulator [Pseudonocardia lacus]